MESFVLIWGRLITKLREDKFKALYFEAKNITEGELKSNTLICYANLVQTDFLKRPGNIELLEEIIFENEGKRYNIEIAKKPEKENKGLLMAKKVFGEKLEIEG